MSFDNSLLAMRDPPSPDLLTDMEDWGTEQVLSWVSDNLRPARLASSFAGESVVLIHLLAEFAPGIEVFTIDTGRLPEATYELIERTRDRYGIEIRVVHPDLEAVSKLVNEKGMFSFRESVENRLECCRIRKVEPLARVLGDARSWVTGLRRDQSSTRAGAGLIEWDERFEVYKVNPLVSWTRERVWRFIRDNDIPYNRLYDEGYGSIGCEPCTRPTTDGESPRAGRWWWETDAAKECGIHNAPPQRTVDES